MSFGERTCHLAWFVHSRWSFICWVALVCGLLPKRPVPLLKVWEMHQCKLCPYLIISSCLSSFRAHIKLKAATDALFKLSSKMILKCVTQLFPWCGQGIYGEVAFPLDMGLDNQKPLYDTCVDVKRKTMKNSPSSPRPISLKTKSPWLFSIPSHVSSINIQRSQNMTWGQESWSRNCPEQKE